MEITVVNSAGFCFGVKKAVDSVYDALQGQEHIVILGELIHNRLVTRDLEKHGVDTIEDVGQCPEDALLVIRTHGVGRATEELARQKAQKVLDLTCPYVAKIHGIVAEYSEKGYDIIIIGDASHPEVIGIKGWCAGKAYVIENEQDARNLRCEKACVVAQTTSSKKKYENLIKIVKNNCQEAIFFDTICKSTKTRQTEAREIAERSDIMFVVGGRGSSNTIKLYEICKKHCPLTFHIESFEEIPQNINYKNKKIGITAGASTPAGSIEEVVRTMEENINGQGGQEMSFEEAMEQSLKTLNTGDVVNGIVVEVRPTEVIVDLGFKSDGIIPAGELTDDPEVKPSDIVKPGDEIQVFVVGVNDAEGKTLLSKKKIDAIEGWKKIEEALENKTIVSGKVVQVVNGGMIVLVEGSRVFVPASQASDRYTEDLSVFLNQTVELRIIEINPRRKRVTGSVRSVLTEQKKALAEKFWAEAEVGKKYTGIVKSLTNFGAFVDIGGVDGLVHISELSWSRIKHPSEVVNVGDTIEVYIKDINTETKKISLGFKKAEDNPWVIAQSKFNVGDVVKCKVVRFMPFGAFVELIPGVDGLIHISQIANRRIGKPADELTIGEEIEAKITEINWENKRISLSKRALLPVEEQQTESAEIMQESESKTEEVVEQVKDKVAGAVSAVKEEAAAVVEKVVETVKEGTVAAMDKVQEVAEKVKENISEASETKDEEDAQDAKNEE